MSCTGLETRKPHYYFFQKILISKKIEKLKFDEDSMDTDVDTNFWIVAITVASHEVLVPSRLVMSSNL